MNHSLLHACSSLARRVLLLIAGVALAGCHVAPDMKPFVDASGQLASSIRATGRAVGDETLALTSSWGEAQQQQAKALVDTFSAHWTARNGLADGLANYSASLAGIVAAGEQGEASAKAVAASFMELTESLDVMPAGAAAGTGIDAAIGMGTWLYGKYAKDRAARTLAKSMQEIQPFIDGPKGVVDLIDKDMASAQHILRTLLNAAENSVDQVKTTTKRAVGDERGTLKSLLARQNALAKQLGGYEEKRDKARETLSGLTDFQALEDKDKGLVLAAAKSDLDRLNMLSADIRAEFTSNDVLIAQSRALLAPFDQSLAAQKSRLRAAIAMISAARDGLADWGAAHARLAAAALESRPPHVADLIDGAQRLKKMLDAFQSPTP